VQVSVVDQIYSMVSKGFGVILAVPFKHVEDPQGSGYLQNANVSLVS
jgi:hypothetical protein